MALSYVSYTANGTVGPYNITFPYLDRAEVFVFVNGVSVGFTFLTGSSIQLNTAAAAGLPILGRRITSQSRKVTYQDASTLLASDLNIDSLQELYIAQETADSVGVTVGNDGNADLAGKVLRNVGTPTLPTDAATKSYVDTVAGSATAAAISATQSANSASQSAASAAEALGYRNNTATFSTNASTSATNAATSETNANTSKNQAASSASAASGSATAAGTSATNAANSEANALSYRNTANSAATAASTSATNAGTSETNALASKNAAATSASNAATSETNAANSAASNNLPSLAGKALNMLRVKSDLSGYEHRTPAQVPVDLGLIKRINIVKVTSSGLYTAPANLIQALVECVGAGGGGGGCASNTSQYGGGGGGASGVVARRLLTAAQIGSTQTITIGTAGPGGAAGNNKGTDGGSTQFGSFVIAAGGIGGDGTGGAGAIGGLASTTGTGDIVIPGVNGFSSPGNAGSGYSQGGTGASSPYGSGGRANGSSASTLAGLPATGNGAGGGGAGAANVAGSAAGGPGTAGVVVITEYLSA